MKKKYKIIIIIAIIVLVIVVLFAIFMEKSPLEVENTNGIIFNTTNGRVLVNDFSKSAVETRDGITYIATEDAYNIFYEISSKIFYITLYATDLQQVIDYRVLAENVLMQKLKVNQEDACKLNNRVSIPIHVYPDMAGVNLGLSFCEDSVKLIQ